MSGSLRHLKSRLPKHVIYRTSNIPALPLFKRCYNTLTLAWAIIIWSISWSLGVFLVVPPHELIVLFIYLYETGSLFQTRHLFVFVLLEHVPYYSCSIFIHLRLPSPLLPFQPFFYRQYFSKCSHIHLGFLYTFPSTITFPKVLVPSDSYLFYLLIYIPDTIILY